MKTTYQLLSFFLTCASLGFTQNSTTLNFNNSGALINDNGILFNDQNTSIAGYELPLGSTKKLIYSSAFWFGGKDENNVLFIDNQTYNGFAYGPGPLTVGTAQPSLVPSLQTIWTISRAEIDYHVAHYQDQGYVMPNDIATWPGNGDFANGFSQYLAPFIDFNGNNLYDPQEGDFPCIKGDKAVYMILNDQSGLSVNPYSIGLEVHYMFYQFASNDYLNNTTFMDLTVYNRGQKTLHDFNVSYFVDGDLGYYGDDYIGCDSSNSLAYYYNGDDNDEAGMGSIGYGIHPPAFGVMSLKQPMTRFSYIPSTISTNMDMYNLMTGHWTDGTVWTNLSGAQTNYIYSGNPIDLVNGDTEIEANNPPGDRRILLTNNFDTLFPNDVLELSYAIVYQDNGVSAFANANDLINNASLVQTYYDANLSASCLGLMAGITENTSFAEFLIEPNPSNGKFNLRMETLSNAEVFITNLAGQKVYEATIINSQTAFQLNVPAGVYLVNVRNGNSIATQRIVIQ
jgi:hypothetical protein